MKNGASHLIAKPINPEKLRKTLKMAVDRTPQPSPPQTERAGAPGNKPMFFGASPYMRELQTRLRTIGWSEAPVLIRGETGVGKEVLARALHAQSPRAKKTFLKLNCAALPSELVESELFGYERGAFTGAFQKKPGMFELAEGGTILLDEIGDMDFKLQAKLLQVLQDQEFQRLGGRDTVSVDVRIIAATHRDLEKAIIENTFREDLFYRMSVVNVHMPPLRQRKEDVLAIAEFLLKKHTSSGTPIAEIPVSLQQVFLDYNWPGNIRELENVIRNFLIFRDADLVARELYAKMDRNPHPVTKPIERSSSNASFDASSNGHSLPLAAIMPVSVGSFNPQNAASILEEVTKAKQEAERAAIRAALKSTNWNRKQAALVLNIDYKALLYKMKKLSIKKEKAAPLPKMLPTASFAAVAGSVA